MVDFKYQKIVKQIKTLNENDHLTTCKLIRAKTYTCLILLDK